MCDLASPAVTLTVTIREPHRKRLQNAQFPPNVTDPAPPFYSPSTRLYSIPPAAGPYKAEILRKNKGFGIFLVLSRPFKAIAMPRRFNRRFRLREMLP